MPAVPVAHAGARSAQATNQEAKLNRATIRYFAFDTEWPFEMTILT
jgi:hypothetical protein